MRSYPSLTLFCALCIGLPVACSKKKSSPAKTKAQAVGRLTSRQGEVDRRPARTLTWSTADEAISLFHRDALKTGSGSRAVVTFSTGGKLEIDERSLVVIEAPPRPKAAPAPTARVEQGTVQGTVAPGTAAVRIVSADGKTTEIKATGDKAVAYRVRVKDGGLEVAVLKGQANVTSAGKTTSLRPNQAVDVMGGQLGAPIKLLPFPDLLNPGVDTKLSNIGPVKLSWREVPGAKRYRLQLSASLDFSSVVRNRLTATLEYTITKALEPGRYAWRVSAIDADGREGEFGFARRFSLIEAAQMKDKDSISPENNAAVEYINQPKPTTFRWEGEADSFTLVVARHPRLRRGVVFRRNVRAKRFTVRRLKPGVYFWGVYAKTKGGVRKLLPHGVRRLVVAWRRPPKVNVPGIKWK